MRNLGRLVQVTGLLTASLLAMSCRESAEGTRANDSPSVSGAGPLEGVWQEAEIVVTGANASTNPQPQPSLYIFTPTHYAMMGTIGDRPRPHYKAVLPTKEEKIAAYDSFWANAGTYELKGDTMTIRPIIARIPNFMAGGFATFRFRLTGDSLWLIGLDEYWPSATGGVASIVNQALGAPGNPRDENKARPGSISIRHP